MSAHTQGAVFHCFSFGLWPSNGRSTTARPTDQTRYKQATEIFLGFFDYFLLCFFTPHVGTLAEVTATSADGVLPT